MRWLARRLARRKAEQVGSEVLTIVREAIELFGDVAYVRREIARRVSEADFLSSRGLEEIRAIDEREAAWLKGLK
jgi:hypothetical protein